MFPKETSHICIDAAMHAHSFSGVVKLQTIKMGREYRSIICKLLINEKVWAAYFGPYSLLVYFIGLFIKMVQQ